MLASLTSAPADATSYSEPAIMTPSTVLVSEADIARVRSHPGKFAGLVKRCSEQIGYQPRPIAVLASRRRYTATGTQDIGDGKILAADAEASYRLGLCYLVTQDRRYAATTQHILDSWAGRLTGVANHQSQGNINFKLPFMITAASWVRGANGWDHSRFDRFVSQVVVPQSESDNPNNHGMWGVLLEASAARYLGDAAGLAKARNRWGEIIAGAAAPDGTLTREIMRSNTSNFRDGPGKGIKGMAYTHYFLLPASLAGKIFADAGTPVWDTDSGRLLGAAFRKAAGWTLRPDTFPYHASNGGKLEGVNSISYFPLLLHIYENPDAEAVLRSGVRGSDAFFLEKLFAADPARRKR